MHKIAIGIAGVVMAALMAVPADAKPKKPKKPKKPNPFQQLQLNIDAEAVKRLAEDLGLKGVIDADVADLQAQIDELRGLLFEFHPPTKTVFVTTNSFNGNLRGGEPDGLAGADKKCQLEADAAGLTGNWMAWLSDGVDSPDTRFNKNPTSYVLPDGTPIAFSYADLTDGHLVQSINQTADGRFPPTRPLGSGVFPWTNTDIDGTPDSLARDCENWTLSLGFPDVQFGEGLTGNHRSNLADWTHAGGLFGCDGVFPLYCFEQ